MDFQAVPPPSQYGAPNVFQQQASPAAQGQQGAQGQQANIATLLAKAKQLLSSGQISPDQYNQVAQQVSTMSGSAGYGVASSPPPNAPLNILPGSGS